MLIQSEMGREDRGDWRSGCGRNGVADNWAMCREVDTETKKVQKFFCVIMCGLGGFVADMRGVCV